MAKQQNEKKRADAIARCQEVAKHYGLEFEHEMNGPWVTMYGLVIGHRKDTRPRIAEIKARGWKHASDLFCAEATKWYMNQRQESGKE